MPQRRRVIGKLDNVIEPQSRLGDAPITSVDRLEVDLDQVIEVKLVLDPLLLAELFLLEGAFSLSIPVFSSVGREVAAIRLRQALVDVAMDHGPVGAFATAAEN